MNIEQYNSNYIRNTFGSNPNVAGSSDIKSNTNYDLIQSVLKHRKVFGIISSEELEKHHAATKKYIRTVII